MLEGVAVPVCRMGFLPFLPISVALISRSQADLRLGTLGIHDSVPGPTGSYFTGALAARRQAEKLGLLKLPTVQQLPETSEIMVFPILPQGILPPWVSSHPTVPVYRPVLEKPMVSHG